MRPLVLLWGCLVLPGYGAIMGPKKIRGFEGDTVSLQCTYGENLGGYKKYWCRKSGILFGRCSGIIYATEDGKERTEGRVSIQDSLWNRTLNVTLRNLALQDSGEYWCGVNRLGLDEIFLVSLIVLPGTSRPSTNLDSTSAEDTSLVLRSSSSKSRVSPTVVRILAPVLVLLTLLLVTGLAAIGGCVLRWRKQAQLATETQKKQINLSHLPLGNSLVPEYAVINLAAPTGPLASPNPPASTCTDIRCQSQTAEEEEASFQDLEAEASPGPPLHTAEEELRSSMFVPV